MKGLDTPVLLGLFRGDQRVVALLRKWEGEELCTTSLNLFELETIARRDPSAGRERRLGSIDRLRRKLTILPVDERAAQLAAVEASRSDQKGSPTPSWLILGALLGGGCSEWATVREANFPQVADLKLTLLSSSTTKNV